MTKKRYQIAARAYNSAGRLISTGVNSYTRTHPIQAYFAKQVGEPARIYLHAEIQAILRAKATKIHTLKIHSNNGPMPFPCKVCQAAIKAYGIKEVVVSSSTKEP